MCIRCIMTWLPLGHVALYKLIVSHILPKQLKHCRLVAVSGQKSRIHFQKPLLATPTRIVAQGAREYVCVWVRGVVPGVKCRAGRGGRMRGGGARSIGGHSQSAPRRARGSPRRADADMRPRAPLTLLALIAVYITFCHAEKSKFCESFYLLIVHNTRTYRVYLPLDLIPPSIQLYVYTLKLLISISRQLTLEKILCVFHITKWSKAQLK